MEMRSSLKKISVASITVLLIGASALAQLTPQARGVRPASVTGDLMDITRANDGESRTRATSGDSNYVGKSILIDVGGEQNITGVRMEHSPWATHFPAAFRVEVGKTANGPWFQAFEGAGTRGNSRVVFPAVRGRHIRITATAANREAPDWTVSEIEVGVDPGQTAREIPSAGGGGQQPPTSIGKELRDLNLAFDKNPDTRASSGTADYAGTSLTYDLGGEYEISRVTQVHGRWNEDYPGQYKVEVSRRKDEGDFREVWRGAGEPGRSIARFDPVNTRYIRLTALRSQDRTHGWSIAELRTNRDEDVVDEDTNLERAIRRATAQGLDNISSVIDDSPQTRATTGRANYIGSHVVLDLGGSYSISKVVQVHDPADREFAARYKVEVSEDGRTWQQVWEGAGERNRSRATFNPVRARYVRITATDDRNNRVPWSISKLRVLG